MRTGRFRWNLVPRLIDTRRFQKSTFPGESSSRKSTNPLPNLAKSRTQVPEGRFWRNAHWRKEQEALYKPWKRHAPAVNCQLSKPLLHNTTHLVLSRSVRCCAGGATKGSGLWRHRSRSLVLGQPRCAGNLMTGVMFGIKSIFSNFWMCDEINDIRAKEWLKYWDAMSCLPARYSFDFDKIRLPKDTFYLVRDHNRDTLILVNVSRSGKDKDSVYVCAYMRARVCVCVCVCTCMHVCVRVSQWKERARRMRNMTRGTSNTRKPESAQRNKNTTAARDAWEKKRERDTEREREREIDR